MIFISGLIGFFFGFTFFYIIAVIISWKIDNIPEYRQKIEKLKRDKENEDALKWR